MGGILSCGTLNYGVVEHVSISISAAFVHCLDRGLWLQVRRRGGNLVTH